MALLAECTGQMSDRSENLSAQHVLKDDIKCIH